MQSKKISAVLCAAAILCFSQAAGAKSVVDHQGNTVEVPEKIEKIAVVGILPLPSTLAIYLGSAEKLVAIPPASMGAAKAGFLAELFPEIKNAKTSFISGSDVNIEELMSIGPDIVFYNAADKKQTEMYKNAGIPAVAISPRKWGYDVLKTYDSWIATLGEIFADSSKVRKISEYSKLNYAKVQERVKDIPDGQRKKVLFLFQYDDKKMVTSGKNFFGQFWCDASGALNAAESVTVDNANAVITMEQVYGWDPDIVVITNFTKALPDDLYGSRIAGHDWSRVKAVKNRAVYKMPLGAYRSYTPCADTPLTLLWMAQKVYPDRFADIDIKKETAAYYRELFGLDLSKEQIDRMYSPSRSAADGFIR